MVFTRSSRPSWVSAAAAARVDFDGNVSSMSEAMFAEGRETNSNLQRHKTDFNLGFAERSFSAAGAAVLSVILVNPLDVAKVIERIHENFFSHKSLHDVDVRNILASEKRKILGGCCILFSRVIPVGEVNPHLHPLWQSAKQFGAVCTNQIDEQVTHVVANFLGTDKVNWALSTGRFVVHPSWVEASALLYRRANEHDFAIKP